MSFVSDDKSVTFKIWDDLWARAEVLGGPRDAQLARGAGLVAGARLQHLGSLSSKLSDSAAQLIWTIDPDRPDSVWSVLASTSLPTRGAAPLPPIRRWARTLPPAAGPAAIVSCG